eukprot:6461621-Amphidinium_carterae.1
MPLRGKWRATQADARNHLCMLATRGVHSHMAARHATDQVTLRLSDIVFHVALREFLGRNLIQVFILDVQPKRHTLTEPCYGLKSCHRQGVALQEALQERVYLRRAAQYECYKGFGQQFVIASGPPL